MAPQPSTSSFVHTALVFEDPVAQSLLIPHAAHCRETSRSEEHPEAETPWLLVYFFGASGGKC
jgi:hypothetical protein